MPTRVWLSRLGPLNARPKLSVANSDLWEYPRFASRPTPLSLILKIPNEFQLDESLELNRLPLEEAQSDGASGKTESEQPYSDNTTIDSGEAVDTSTRTYCSGVPARMKKLLQGPSMPSLGFY